VSKVSVASQLAGIFTSLWLAGTQPAAGLAPTAAALCTKATQGSGLNFVNAGAGNALYLAKSDLAPGNAGALVETHDRICHMGGLSGIVTTAQNVNLSPVALGAAVDRTGPVAGDAAYTQLRWFIEIYTSLGATGITATISYTNAAGTAGRITTVAVAASSAASRSIPIFGLTGEAIQSIQTIQFSATTGTAGNFGITCSRKLCANGGSRSPVANWSDAANWAELGLPLVGNNACIAYLTFNITTTSGTVIGDQYVIEI
jgi:hypothetical protein